MGVSRAGEIHIGKIPRAQARGFFQEFPIFRWEIPSLLLTRAAGNLHPRDQGGARKAPP